MVERLKPGFVVKAEGTVVQRNSENINKASRSDMLRWLTVTLRRFLFTGNGNW